METPEVIKMLTWINSFDARVQLNEPNVTTWAYAMRNAEAQYAKTAVLEHRRLYPTAPTPSEIATRSRHLKASETASARALEAKPTEPMDELPLRKRDPERWEARSRKSQERTCSMKNHWKALAAAMFSAGASNSARRACEAGRTAHKAAEGVVCG